MVENTRKLFLRGNRAEIIKRRLNEAFQRHVGLTNKELADYCKVTEQAVHKWRRTGMIRRDNVPHVASFFGERPNWLLDDLTEVKEPMNEISDLSQRERKILEALRALPPTVAGELEKHILMLAKTLTGTSKKNQ